MEGTTTQSVQHAVNTIKETAKDVAGAAEAFVDAMEEGGESSGSRSQSVDPKEDGNGDDEDMDADADGDADEEETIEPKKRQNIEERKARMAQLRKKIALSSKANRATLIADSTQTKLNSRDMARLEKQRRLADMLRSQAASAMENPGEDMERKKNWEWTIEENDAWEKKLARKKRRADYEFHDDAHAARRRYKKDLDLIKPDLEAYNRQKELAMGLGPAGLTSFDPGSGSSAVVATTSQQQLLAAENLYRDANTLIYGDNKPTEDAIDRVVSKINKDIDKKGKFSRKRLNEDEGDITYINEHNRVFNKKIARYYDKYTAEIRASFERGTAL